MTFITAAQVRTIEELHALMICRAASRDETTASIEVEEEPIDCEVLKARVELGLPVVFVPLGVDGGLIVTGTQPLSMHA